MTVIVGILCDGGVAIASDRQATSAAFLPLLQPQPIQTSTHFATKITPIGNQVLLAVSGMISIGDEYQSIIKKYEAKFSKNSYDAAVRKLKDEVRESINQHLETAKLLHQAIGVAQAYAQCTCECLLAANFHGGPKLIQIQTQGALDVATEELPIRTIGSGQIQADPFASFLRRTFWPDRLPTVDEGVLCAIWAVEYAIEVGAEKVGGGIDAFTISKRGHKFLAKQVSEDQMTGNRDFIREARAQLRQIADLRQTTTVDARKIPTISE